jgi:3-(3-hydroxy-phenyl)propionate hydroxylase
VSHVRGCYDCDVLICGLGPTGLALALLLVRRGLTVIAVERDIDAHSLPRAAHIDHEIMRLFQELDVLDGIAGSVRQAPPYEFRAAGGDVLLRFDPDAAASPSGWANGYMIHQPGIERALRCKLAESPLAEMRSGTALETLAQDDYGVTAELSGPDGPAAVRTRYLVGCDGASSCVRGQLGIELDDGGFDEPWLVIDALVPDPDTAPRVNLQICDPARPTTCVVMSAGRHRWEFMLLPGETPEQVLDDSFIGTLLAPWHPDDAWRLERKAVYRFHALVAKSWRHDRVLLAGDAAHQMPPFAGQGMCSGLRDAANLAWKLDAVLRRGVTHDLLDSYQSERLPHVRAYIASAISMGQVVCLLDPEAAARRDAAMLAARARGGSALPPLQPPLLGAGCRLAGNPGAGELFPQPWAVTSNGTLRLDDVLEPGAWLIGAGVESARSGAAVEVTSVPLDSPRLAPFRTSIEAWLVARSAEAVLVRSDRYVFGTGMPQGLLDAFSAALKLADDWEARSSDGPSQRTASAGGLIRAPQ